MQFNTTTEGNQEVTRILATATPQSAEGTRATVLLKEGVAYYGFTHLADGNWRLGYVVYYGTYHGVGGRASDASGFVITDPKHIAKLDGYRH